MYENARLPPFVLSRLHRCQPQGTVPSQRCTDVPLIQHTILAAHKNMCAVTHFAEGTRLCPPRTKSGGRGEACMEWITRCEVACCCVAPSCVAAGSHRHGATVRLG